MSTKKVSGGKAALPRMIARIAAFISRARSIDCTMKVLYGSVVLACVVITIVVLAVVVHPRLAPTQHGDIVPIVRHPLTGVVQETAPETLPSVFGVMVENSVDAWPLAGLDDAFLVFEAPAEANIPRFVAFFGDDATTEKIGPVRSARPYYLDWASEFGAVYAHVGGSPEALELLPATLLSDCNEFFNGGYFYRATSRYAPHNVYTTMENLLAFQQHAEASSGTYDMWKFKDDAPSGEAHSLSIDWTTGTTYDIVWTYDVATDTYARNQIGARAFLENNVTLRANNVVVMETEITIIDNQGRRHIRTLGEGDALIAQDGRVVVGTWQKETQTERTRFYSADGSEIAMNAGATWVEVVSSLGQATITD